MRLTRFFFQTLREEQSEAELISHQLMLRAGLVRQVAAGIFSYLPIGRRIDQELSSNAFHGLSDPDQIPG